MNRVIVTETAMIAVRALLVVVFATAFLGKLRGEDGIAGFADWIAGLRVMPRPWTVLAARATLTAEAAIVALLLTPWTALPGLVLAALVLAVFAAATLSVHRRGITAQCRCFGAAAAPLGRRHVLRDALLAATALAALAGAGLAAPPIPGLALGAAAGALVALGVVFLDDIASLFDF